MNTGETPNSGSLTVPRIGATLLLLLVISCGRNATSAAPNGSPAPDESMCRLSPNFTPPSFTLVGSFAATAAELVSWEESPVAPGAPFVTPSRWRNRAPTETLAICYFDGPPSTKQGGPPGPGATPLPPPTAGRWVIVRDANGGETIVKIGDPARVQITRRVP